MPELVILTQRLMLRTVYSLGELGFGSATQPGSGEDGRDVEQGQAGMRGV